MDTGEDIKAVKSVLQALLKARKNLRLYPTNNPIYARTIEESLEKFNEFFEIKDKLVFRIRLYEMYYQDELVYQNNDQRNDNLSFFLYKDGLRELTFHKNLPAEELEAFLKIISLDFDQEVLDDDVVTLFWERDFSCIRYVVDDDILSDEDYETQAVASAQDQKTDPASLQSAHDDAMTPLKAREAPTIVTLTESDLQKLSSELEDDAKDKLDKFMVIIFEMLGKAKTIKEVEDAVDFFNSIIEYAVREGNLSVVTQTLERLSRVIRKESISETVKQYIKSIFLFAAGPQVIDLIGRYYDSGQKPDPRPFYELMRFFDKDSIPPLMDLLGELESIHARKVIIDALIFLSQKSFLTIAKGLSSPKWYVVRNIIYILRESKDPRAVEYFLKTTGHPDIRVRKEVIRAMGESGDPRVLPAIQSFLNDPDMQTRLVAVRALGALSFETARASLLDQIAAKTFNDKEFNEKKEFYHVLATWKDKELIDFLIKTLMKTSLLGSAKIYENRACAAYSLGLIGDKSALPYLFKCRATSNKLFREFLETAIQRIENESRVQA